MNPLSSSMARSWGESHAFLCIKDDKCIMRSLLCRLHATSPNELRTGAGGKKRIAFEGPLSCKVCHSESRRGLLGTKGTQGDNRSVRWNGRISPADCLSAASGQRGCDPAQGPLVGCWSSLCGARFSFTTLSSVLRTRDRDKVSIWQDGHQTVFFTFTLMWSVFQLNDLGLDYAWKNRAEWRSINVLKGLNFSQRQLALKTTRFKCLVLMRRWS